MSMEVLIDEGYSPYDRANQILTDITYGSNVVELATDFGFEGYEGGGLSENLKQLQEFTNEYWDFRGGGERWDSNAPEFSVTQSEEIFGRSKNIAGYNLVDSTYLEAPVRAITILGGGNASGLQRIEYTKENTDQIETNPDLYLLGSARKVSDAERPKTDEFSPGAITEFDLMNSAIERVYEIDPYFGELETVNDDITGKSILDYGLFEVLNAIHFDGTTIDGLIPVDDSSYWAIKTYQLGNFTVRSLLAPQIEGNRRANTADTMGMLRSRFGSELAAQKLAASTNSIYTAFQDIDLLRMIGIPLGAQTSTFGFSAEYSGIERQPYQLLQEINSAINSAVSLDNSIS